MTVAQVEVYMANWSDAPGYRNNPNVHSGRGAVKPQENAKSRLDQSLFSCQEWSVCKSSSFH